MDQESLKNLISEAGNLKKDISMLSIKFKTDKHSNAGLQKTIKNKKKELARLFTKINMSKE